jgi:methylmalonyl-CoA mutase
MKTDLAFSEFAPVSKEQWKQKAIEDLKGADFDKKLVWKTDDGFPVQPFYTSEDMVDFDPSYFSSPKIDWTNYVEIKADSDVECNQIALQMKKFGAEGFLFKFDDPNYHNFETLLNGLDPLSDHISFSTSQPSAVLISDYLVHLNRSYIRAHKLDGFYESDILENWSVTGVKPKFHDLANLLKRSKPYPNFRCLVVRSHSFVNAGCNTTQELAFTLHKVSDYIEALLSEGLTTTEIIDELVLHMAIGGDYFFEIAKLRALRILLDDILEFYQCKPQSIPIISSGSMWSKSFYDPNVNLLRNTSEAMSAILGGCDALMINPHDSTYQQPTDFSRRIALNVANILKEESYFDKVADPASGSYYIENLTRSLVSSTLSLFREIEAKGGYISAFKNNIIQAKIKEQREKKEKEIGSRKRVFVGTNKYPEASDEHVVCVNASENGVANVDLLPQQRATRICEEMRSRTIDYFKHTGNIPEVYLACFGNLALRKARATFASDFFATAGFEILGEYFNKDVVQLATDAANSNADIVVLCSSDDDYATGAVPFAEALRTIDEKKILVLAGYLETLVESLKAAGFDEFIHVKSNAVDVLTNLQNKLLV